MGAVGGSNARVWQGAVIIEEALIAAAAAAVVVKERVEGTVIFVGTAVRCSSLGTTKETDDRLCHACSVTVSLDAPPPPPPLSALLCSELLNYRFLPVLVPFPITSLT